MSKFNHYLEKAREQNIVGREILEEEKIKIADEIIDSEEESCCEDKECNGKTCKEKEITESLSIKTKVKLVLESNDEPTKKAKQIKKLFFETGIDQKQIVERLSTSFGVDANIKEELLKYY
jgi:hypothetical protein